MAKIYVIGRQEQGEENAVFLTDETGAVAGFSSVQKALDYAECLPGLDWKVDDDGAMAVDSGTVFLIFAMDTGDAKKRNMAPGSTTKQ
jgi:hypothetical protein